MLDAAVAKSLKSFADALEGTPEDEFQDAALEYCKKVLTDHQRILFSGDGYSDEWPVEAEKRGLANNKTTADALPAFVSDKAIALFEETGVLTKAEAQCRYDCKLEKYNKLMNIEATTMVREARRTYRPVITAYATKVAKGLETIRAAGAEAAMQCEQNTLNKLCNGITTINDSIKALDAVHQKAEASMVRSRPTCMHTRSFPLWIRCAPPWMPWRRSWPPTTGRSRPTTTFCSTCRTGTACRHG